jgi:hypothetical protein
MVRLLLWFMALLAALTSVGWQYMGPVRRPELAGYVWRRTTSGWEHIPLWRPPERREAPTIHPLLVASLQLSLSLLALEAVPAGSQDAFRHRVG